MKCTFAVGQQVVCVKEGPWESIDDGEQELGARPTKDRVYTIAAMRMWPRTHPDFVGLKLVEINHPGRWWDAEAFRPVKKTDISIFEAMLVPALESEWTDWPTEKV